MRILLGVTGISVVGTKTVPTVEEICKADRRMIYLGDVIDSSGKELHDAFIYTLDPCEVYTIKENGIKFIEENIISILIEQHSISLNSIIKKELIEKYSDEVYVGTVYDSHIYSDGRVWHDTYKSWLFSPILYMKKNGKKIMLPKKYMCGYCLSYPDRNYWRMTVTTGAVRVNYSFLFGDRAFATWLRFIRKAKPGQKVLHNFGETVEDIGDREIYEYFKSQGTELCEKYAKSYDRTGFLARKL